MDRSGSHRSGQASPSTQARRVSTATPLPSSRTSTSKLGHRASVSWGSKARWAPLRWWSCLRVPGSGSTKRGARPSRTRTNHPSRGVFHSRPSSERDCPTDPNHSTEEEDPCGRAGRRIHPSASSTVESGSEGDHFARIPPGWTHPRTRSLNSDPAPRRWSSEGRAAGRRSICHCTAPPGKCWGSSAPKVHRPPSQSTVSDAVEVRNRCGPINTRPPLPRRIQGGGGNSSHRTAVDHHPGLRCVHPDSANPAAVESAVDSIFNPAGHPPGRPRATIPRIASSGRSSTSHHSAFDGGRSSIEDSPPRISQPKLPWLPAASRARTSIRWRSPGGGASRLPLPPGETP